MIPRLAALATAVPPFAIDQDRGHRADAAALRRLGPVQLRLLPVFANSGIDRRYSAVPPDWFERPHSWPERNRAYVAGALDLTETVAGRLLDRAEARIDEIGAIVTVSTTGIATPSLDALLIERMRLPRDVQRLPVFGLGCAGGAIGLGKAAALARSMPDRAVLLLVVELCTLAFHRNDDGNSDIVAAALFGDGAAGALLRCHGDGPAIVASGEHSWPDSLGVMGWDIVDEGLKAIFSRDIPAPWSPTELGGAARGFPPGTRWSPPTSTGSSATPADPRSSPRARPRSASPEGDARATPSGCAARVRQHVGAERAIRAGADDWPPAATPGGARLGDRAGARLYARALRVLLRRTGNERAANRPGPRRGCSAVAELAAPPLATRGGSARRVPCEVGCASDIIWIVLLACRHSWPALAAWRSRRRHRLPGRSSRSTRPGRSRGSGVIASLGAALDDARIMVLPREPHFGEQGSVPAVSASQSMRWWRERLPPCRLRPGAVAIALLFSIHNLVGPDSCAGSASRTGFAPVP